MYLNRIELNCRNSSFGTLFQRTHMRWKLISKRMSISLLLHSYRRSCGGCSSLCPWGVVVASFVLSSIPAFRFRLLRTVITLGFVWSSCFTTVFVRDEPSSHSSSTSSSLCSVKFAERLSELWGLFPRNSCLLGKENVGSFIGVDDSSAIKGNQRLSRSEREINFSVGALHL